MTRIIFALALMVGALSNAGDLTINLGAGVDETSILPVGLGSCADQNIVNPAPAFAFNYLMLSWNGVGTFTPTSLSFTVQDWPQIGQNYYCLIDGKGLGAIFASPLLSGTKMRNSCGLRCGNVPISPDICSAELNGNITINGTVTLPNQSVADAKASVLANLQYLSFSGICP